MSEAAVNALRAAFAQFARGEFGAFAALPDEFELELAAEMPDSGTHQGESARSWLNSWVGSFDRMEYEALDFVDAGDRIAIELVQRGWQRGSERPVELRHWAVVTVDDGQLRRMQLFLRKADAFAAAGLSDGR